MAYRRITAILLAGLSIIMNVSIHAQTEKRPILVVLPLSANHVSEIESRQITLHINDHLKRTGLYIVLDIAHIENVMQDMGIVKTSRIEMPAALSVGNFLSADMLIIGTLSKDGVIYHIDLESIDVSEARIDRKNSIQSQLGFEELPTAIAALLDPIIQPESKSLPSDPIKVESKETVADTIIDHIIAKEAKEDFFPTEHEEFDEQKSTVINVEPKQGDIWCEPLTGMKFVWVPAGEFMMGSDSGHADERPVHLVRITSGFWMGKYEVTQGQWQKIMKKIPARFKKGENYPVENVSWIDTQEFIRRLNKRSGKKFRLPTEAEWEYACRAGTPEDLNGDLNDIAWYEVNSIGSTQPVGIKQPNGFGIYDMLGNVWEWCQDWYGKNYYSQSPKDNPHGPSWGFRRIRRGGSWLDNAQNIRSAVRIIYTPSGKGNFVGFRLVRSE